MQIAGRSMTQISNHAAGYTATVVAAMTFAILETGTFPPLTQGSPGPDIGLIVILVRAMRTLAVPQPLFQGNKTCAVTQFGACCSQHGYCRNSVYYCKGTNWYSRACF